MCLQLSGCHTWIEVLTTESAAKITKENKNEILQVYRIGNDYVAIELQERE